MDRTLRIASVAALVLSAVGVGCTDPTVAPKSTVTSANIFNDPTSYRAFLAKIYGGLIVTGERGPDGNPDISGIDEGFGEYLRLYWYLQEMPTDEAVIGWNDPGLPDLNTGTWGSSNSMVNAMYYRVFYQVMLVNEFLRQSTDAKLDSRGQVDATLRTDVHFYRAEARFLRALSYWHGIDLFGNIPLVTENDPLGATPPKQATRADIYAYAVSEVNDIIGQLPPRGPSTYGRATPEAAHMLLAKLYLNAGVYTGTLLLYDRSNRFGERSRGFHQGNRRSQVHEPQGQRRPRAGQRNGRHRLPDLPARRRLSHLRRSEHPRRRWQRGECADVPQRRPAARLWEHDRQFRGASSGRHDSRRAGPRADVRSAAAQRPRPVRCAYGRGVPVGVEGRHPGWVGLADVPRSVSAACQRTDR